MLLRWTGSAQNRRMVSSARHRLSVAVLLLAASVAARADDVTLYRCVGAKGAIAVQDQPCPKGMQQSVLKMVRPVDAPPPPQPSPPAAPAPPPVEVRVVSERYPQPMYECTNAETGETYLSRSGVPQSRAVPYWTLGAGDGFFVRGQLTPSQALHPPPPLRPPNQAPPPPTARPPRHGSHGRFAGGLAGYAYVEDSCVRLPQNEVCGRLRERDDALRKLIFNGQQDDRERYEREQKGLREQIREECG